MTPAQIIDYVRKWWLGRETMDKKNHYSPSIHAYDNKDMEGTCEKPHGALAILPSG